MRIHTFENYIYIYVFLFSHIVFLSVFLILFFSTLRIIFCGSKTFYESGLRALKVLGIMHNLQRIITRLNSISLSTNTSSSRLLNEIAKPAFRSSSVIPSKGGFEAYQFLGSRSFSAVSGSDGENDVKDDWDKTVTGTFGSPGSDDLGWDSVSSWSTGLTKDHFDGEVAGHRASGGDGSGDAFQSLVISDLQEIDDKIKELEAENRKSKAFVEGWGERMRETCVLLKQVREPGARGSYLKDSEKAEMYRLHKENPEIYTVEKLAKDYRIMRQRVHAILWLKELEEEEEKKLGHPLDDSVELLLDTCPE